MTLSMLSGPVLEPISVVDAKAHMRIDHDDENELIAALITTARLHVERITRKVMLAQSWRLYLDHLPADRSAKIGIGPVRSIDQVTTYASDGEAIIIAPQNYMVDLIGTPARVHFNSNASKTITRALNAYEIDFTIGFGTTTLDVPAELRQAILMLTAHWYENRGAVIAGTHASAVPGNVQDLVQPFKVMGL